MANKQRTRTLDEFTPQLANANKHTQRGLSQLEAAMRQHGYVAPMTAAADGQIIDGSARAETAANVFGDDVLVVEHDGTRPVVMVRTDIESADSETARLISYEANRVAQLNLVWDAEVLLGDINAGLNMSGLFDDEELDVLLKGLLNQPGPVGDPGVDVDQAEELRKKYGVELGQLWQLGDHLLICGDCTDEATVARLMDGDVAALAPVDPPYNVGFDYDGATVDDLKIEADYETFSRAWFDVCRQVSERQIVTPGGVNGQNWARWFDAKHCGVWTKSNASTFGRVSMAWCWEPVYFYGEKWPRRRHSDVFDFPVSQQSDTFNHPCPKPLAMWLDLLTNYSEPGDLIYEAFSGSGTTILAAEMLGRRCNACEISPAYVALALERWALATGREPELVEFV